jgi:serine/threonine protein kinase
MLAELVLGKLPEATLDRIARHVERCTSCQEILDTLDDLEDSVVRDLKDASCDEQAPSHAELESQLREAEGLSRLVWQDQAKEGDSADDLPRRLGQYELVERLGQGGMGTVYKALHTRLKRPVALKLLPKDRLQDAQAVARFQREMEAIGRLDHPHLVRAFDAGEADGQLYLAMEFLEGTDLARLVRRLGPLSVANACEAIRQAAQGLAYAHDHGLVHRDVKPSNLLLTTGGEVKVLDLGLARLASDQPTIDETTTLGQVLGTGDFIAPEQGQDPRQADPRSDIYALGCTLYFLLAGEAPFGRSPYDTFLQKVLAHAHEPLPPIQSRRKGLPEDLVAILERMTAKAPSARFQAAAEVARALEAHTAGHALSRALPAGTADGRDRQSWPSRPRDGRKLRGVDRLGVLLAAICLGLVGVLLVVVGCLYGPRLAVVLQSLPDPAEHERMVSEINAEVARMSEDLRRNRARMQEDLGLKVAPPDTGPRPTARPIDTNAPYTTDSKGK